MPLLTGITGFFDKYVLGYALGTAAGPSLEPFVQHLANDAWKLNQVVPLSAEIAAAIEAQAYTGTLDGAGDASETGVNGDRYDALRFFAATAPGTAELLYLWRRGRITPDQVKAGLKKGGLLDEYVQPVMDLFDVRLDPAVIAVAIQRGLLPNSDILPVGPPTATGKVPPMPQVAIDPIAEAIAHGIDEDRLKVLARIVGLPAAPDLAARMTFRGIIDPVDFDRAISEGNTRNEWAPFLFDGFRQIPTAEQFVEGHLRGWLTQQEMYDGTARHGMSQADTDLEFEIHRRPLNVRAITTALARGGKFQPSAGEIADPYEASVHQANLGPEWYDLAIANKYSYPSAFVLRSMAQTGELGNTAAVEQILLEIGWKPSFAAEVAKAWTGGGTAADPNLKKAHTTAWSKAQASYIAEESTAADVQPIFATLGIDPTVAGEIVSVWDEIRALVRAQLSPKEIQKAVQEGVINPATGAAWTLQDGITALMARGYDDADARVLLAE